MPKFKCWEKDNGDGDEGAREVVEDDLRDAALSFAEWYYSRSDWPDEQTVMVRDEAGELHGFTVRAWKDVHFSATEIDLDEECAPGLEREDAFTDGEVKNLQAKGVPR